MLGGWTTVTLMMTSFLAMTSPVTSNDSAKRLYDDLLHSGYNRLIRPVANATDTLVVKLGVRLVQLNDINEKSQIMTTTIWLRQEWHDLNLFWDPREYGGIKIFKVPSEKIWVPDTVLFNNADGQYEVKLMTAASLHADGRVVWEPPAIYKSSCIIDVEFFPFDIQKCLMKFGSWTYDRDQVDLVHVCEPFAQTGDVIGKAMDLRSFSESVGWDILGTEATRNTRSYPCCTEKYTDLTFKIEMRRKTMFHLVNLIIPCVSISFLTVLVFYLPSDSGEKVALCISILLSLTVFFLLLAEMIPPTSIVVPLIGKYLLFTMILVTLSIIVTVIVINVHFRSPATHIMSPWVQRVFLSILPRLLIMPRPYPDGDLAVSDAKPAGTKESKGVPCNGLDATHHGDDIAAYGTSSGITPAFQQDRAVSPKTPLLRSEDGQSCSSLSKLAPRPRRSPLSKEVIDAIDSVNFIAEHLKKEDSDSGLPSVWRRRYPVIMEDWKYVAMVLDRLFLWIFTIACFVGTFGIILQATTLYDDRPAQLSDAQTCYGTYK